MMEKITVKASARIFLIISAIIPSTFPAIFAFWAIVKMLTDSERGELVYILICLMAIFGYLGWWRLLIFYNQRPWINLLLLSIGLTSFIWFFSIEGQGYSWNLPSNRKEIIEWIIFMYPPLVALGFILNLGVHQVFKHSNDSL